jgi:hypothetical protein
MSIQLLKIIFIINYIIRVNILKIQKNYLIKFVRISLLINSFINWKYYIRIAKMKSKYN